MKTFSKKELEAKALEVFELHPNQDKVYAREDGNIFFSENYAELDKGQHKIFPIEREKEITGKEEQGNGSFGQLPAADGTKKASAPKTTTKKATTPKADAKKATTPTAAASKEVKDIKVTAETVIPNTTLGKDGKNPENRQTTQTDK